MKYNLKKITLMFLIAICLFILPGSTSGKLISKSNDFISFNQIEELDYEDAKTYEEMLTFMYINLYSPEDILSFKNQHAYLVAKLNRDSILNVDKETLSGVEIRYSTFYMKTFSYNHGFLQVCKVQARFSAGLEYDVGATSPNKIVSLKGEHVYTGDGQKCMFSGNIFYQLEAGNRFYYSMYGNLYTGGSVNWSVAGTIGIGGSATLSGTISNGTGFIRNISESETYISSGMQP